MKAPFPMTTSTSFLLERRTSSSGGDDVTIVTWSKTVHAALDAARSLARTGIAAEVIDLRTLWPWDTETVYTSVWKTGRLIVAHEGGDGFGIRRGDRGECRRGMLRRAARPRSGASARLARRSPTRRPLEDMLRVDAGAIAAVAASLIR